MGGQKIQIEIDHPDTGSFLVKSKVFKSRIEGQRPAIFITPIFGGIDYIEEILARMLAHSGMNVFITDFMPSLNLKEQVGDLTIHDKTYKKSVIALEKLTEAAGEFPFVDSTRLGLFGMSLGGIFTSLNLKTNSNIKASVILAGGGLHHEILTSSQQPVMVLLKEMRKELFGLKTDEEYRELMASYNEMDSLKVFKNVDPEKILMFISTQDNQVPTYVQVETWHDLRKPKAIFLDVPHYKMISTVPFTHFKEIKNFYEDKFYPGVNRGKEISEAEL